MIIGSCYNLKNKVSNNNILINDVAVPRTNKYNMPWCNYGRKAIFRQTYLTS